MRGSRLARRTDPLELGRVTEQARTIAPPVGLCAGSKMCVPEMCRSSSAAPGLAGSGPDDRACHRRHGLRLRLQGVHVVVERMLLQPLADGSIHHDRNTELLADARRDHSRPHEDRRAAEGAPADRITVRPRTTFVLTRRTPVARRAFENDAVDLGPPMIVRFGRRRTLVGEVGHARCSCVAVDTFNGYGAHATLLGSVEVARLAAVPGFARRERRPASTGCSRPSSVWRIGKGPERPCQRIVACRRVLHRLVDRQNVLEGPALDPVRTPAREVGRSGAYRDRCVHARTTPEHLAAKRLSHHDRGSDVILGVVTPVVRLDRRRRGSRSRSRRDSP